MVHSVLYGVLHALGPHHQNTFKRHIEQHQRIPADHLRHADINVTAHLIEHHGPEEAVKITLYALREMNKKRLIRHLKELIREGNTCVVAPPQRNS